MTTTEKLNVVLFAGGRGASTIIHMLKRHGQINLSILVNAYDDGLSTGRIRRFIPGMLGPSDIRKNIAHLLEDEEPWQEHLKTLLEWRLPESFSFDAGMKLLQDIESDRPTEIPEIRTAFDAILFRVAQKVKSALTTFRHYVKEQQDKTGQKFDFSDCAIGNMLLAGLHLEAGRDFNRAVENFCRLAEVKHRVVNVTDGSGLVLLGMKRDGQILKDEAEIVSKQSNAGLADIFLLKDYLPETELASLQSKSYEEKAAYFKNIEVFPDISNTAKQAIESAHIIIYGPGTQHSSLFPSYITRGVGEAVVRNQNAEKIFISNIFKDFEIQSESVNSLLDKLLYYLRLKDQVKLAPDKLVSTFFFQTEGTTSNGGEQQYVPFDRSKFPFPLDRVVMANWETAPGKHSGARVLEELVSLVNTRLQRELSFFPHTVSIVVPCLDEERTVGNVLHDLSLLNLEPMGLGKEIILVDGGSKDRSVALASEQRDVRILKLPRGTGRGQAIKAGVEAAAGNIIVMFPSDGEYKAHDVKTVINGIMSGEFRAVYGSRSIKCVDLSDRVLEIYQGKRIQYLVSKYGGMLLSILCLLLYNRYISDPLTTLKAFDARLLKAFKLRSKGVDLDLEILAKLGVMRSFILEVPVEFAPRLKSQGKKTTMWDGFSAIWALIRYRFAKVEKSEHEQNAINSYSRV